MNSILDAVLAAQERNTREDRLRQLRQQEMAPVLPTGVKPILPIIQDSGNGGDGSSNQYKPDTRTPAEKYQDMVDANRNQGLGVLLPGGMAMGLLNDYQIAQMEEKYPNLRPKDPYTDYARSRFSNVGQVMLGRGYPTQQGQTVETLWDRITGRTPTWAESLARTNQPVPVNTRNFNLGGDGGGSEGDIGGYKAESLSYDSYDPSDDYGYA